MTGRLSGVQTLLEKDTEPFRSPNTFIRVWCGLHQLDLVAQEEYNRLCDDRFVSGLTTLLSWLRRQYSMIIQMKTICPKFVSTRWLSMYKVTPWLYRHRDRVICEVTAKSPHSAPDDSWWIALLSLNVVAGILAMGCKRLQGLTTLLTQQVAELDGLAGKLSKLCKVTGPLTSARIHQLLPSNEYVIRGAYAVKVDDARAFIEDRGQIAIDALGRLSSDESSASIRSIAGLFAGFVDGISKVVATRNSNNKALNDELPPVLPHQLLTTRTARLCEIVQLHRQRLEAVGWTKEKVSMIETEHQQLLEVVDEDDILRKALGKCTDSNTDFENGWKLLSGRYETLQQFCGALATVFPNTASVESDFSVIGWERNEYRHSLTDFSLEGILHAKQLRQVSALNSIKG